MFTPQLNLFRDRRPTPRLSIGPSPALLTDARFIGNPIDFVVFDGYTQMKDEKGDTINVVLVEEKKGKGRLTLEVALINGWLRREERRGGRFFSKMRTNVVPVDVSCFYNSGKERIFRSNPPCRHFFPFSKRKGNKMR